MSSRESGPMLYRRVAQQQRAARWYILASHKEVQDNEKISLLRKSYYVLQGVTPMNSHTQGTLIWQNGFNFAEDKVAYKQINRKAYILEARIVATERGLKTFTVNSNPRIRVKLGRVKEKGFIK